jgi:hypothetical protein
MTKLIIRKLIQFLIQKPFFRLVHKRDIRKHRRNGKTNDEITEMIDRVFAIKTS